MRNVCEIDLTDPTQEDINRIGGMENLRSLTLGVYEAELDATIDFSPLTRLSRLQELWFFELGGGDIDFSFIRDIPGLSNIHFTKCTALKDLSLFRDMPGLITLDVSYVDDVDLTYLSGCEFLRNIQITGGHIRNAEGLSKLKHLQNVCLCETQPYEAPVFMLQDIYQHSDMAELESVELRHIHVTDLEPLTGSPNIRRIRLVDTGIDDIEPLRELKHLNHLEIFGNESERVKEQAELYFGDIDYLEIKEEVPYGL